jgi:ABC-2 type transport system permease protein
MQITRLVFNHELVTTLQRGSFQFAALGMPLLALFFFGILPALRGDPSQAVEPTAITEPSAEAGPDAGYVDGSGLLAELPNTPYADLLRPFPDEAAAKQALESGEIKVYYLVAADYLSSGKVVAVREDFNPLGAFGEAGAIRRALELGLLGGDAQLQQRLNNPLDLQVTLRQPEERRDPDNPLTFFLPYTATLLFYIAILTSASLLLSSVNKDKENRMLEVLLVSSQPTELLAGKIIGLGVAGLVQTAIWLATAAALVVLRGQDIPFLADYPLSGDLIVAGLVFFILGYALYASLMASIGALAPNLREASQLSFFLVVPMLLPLMLINLIIREPNGWVATFLSLFPLTSPVTMIARLVSTSVPAWQVLLAIVLLVVSTYFVLRIVARLFRAQVLLSGQSFSLPRLRALLQGAE